MAPFLDEVWGNPGSAHRWGREARKHLDQARGRIAALLGILPGEVFFTRGGTESLNLAILGRVEAARTTNPSPLVVTSGLEHSAVTEAVAEHRRTGGESAILPIRPDGSVDTRTFESLLVRNPALVTLQWVNPEVGLILPVEEVADRCAAAGIPFHVDAVQAAGVLPLVMDGAGPSLLSLAGHKVGGPRSGGLLVRRRGVELHPRLFGGGQEGELRPGTADVASAVGMATALEMAQDRRAETVTRLTTFRSALEAILKEGAPGVRVHGEEGPRAPHILGVGIPDLSSDLVVGALDLAGVAASSGPACRSGSARVSPTLLALHGEEYARSVAPLRLSMGWSTTEEEIVRAGEIAVQTLERLRGEGV